ncbi:hypothetical protein [Microbacterium sp. SD291]|uniref:hypothetical protein n=1 Tax=Microbacterium sp. SD291 TaxID=2782007 RepID=UPI001A95E3B6|nr:hypothetical protein [Microbacterium sp. SD291]MBO0980591.1 hypothetical protein [Microbacterium sp. SD291]
MPARLRVRLILVDVALQLASDEVPVALVLDGDCEFRVRELAAAEKAPELVVRVDVQRRLGQTRIPDDQPDLRLRRRRGARAGEIERPPQLRRARMRSAKVSSFARVATATSVTGWNPPGS